MPHPYRVSAEVEVEPPRDPHRWRGRFTRAVTDDDVDELAPVAARQEPRLPALPDPVADGERVVAAMALLLLLMVVIVPLLMRR